MKKFLGSTILFCIPLLFIGGTIEILVRNIPNSYKLKYDYIQSNNIDSMQLAILGSSHTEEGVVAQDLSINGFNFASSGQDLYHDLFILNKIQNSKNLRYIVVPISYFTFYYSIKNKEPTRPYLI